MQDSFLRVNGSLSEVTQKMQDSCNLQPRLHNYLVVIKRSFYQNLTLKENISHYTWWQQGTASWCGRGQLERPPFNRERQRSVEAMSRAQTREGLCQGQARHGLDPWEYSLSAWGTLPSVMSQDQLGAQHQQDLHIPLNEILFVWAVW